MSSPAPSAAVASSRIPFIPGASAAPPPAEPRPLPNFTPGLIPARDLVDMPLDMRIPLLGAWMREGDLGYLFAPRGAGKSWMAMMLGSAVAQALPLGEWAAGELARRVIYFDAEMNLADVQERAIKLGITCPNFTWLSNEQLFLKGGKGVNIANTEHQDALSLMLPDGCLFIIDNLSTAQIGMSENDNDSFDYIRDWLLTLRHRSITVLIVHHAGRNGSMRGASRREDIAHWIISLKEAGDEDGKVMGFTTSFAKCRNCSSRFAMPLHWALAEIDGRLHITCTFHQGQDTLLAHVREGVGSASELAELMGVQAGTVSKWAKKLMDAGKLKKKGRDYCSVD